MPEGGVSLLPHEDILTYEEIIRVVRVFAKRGITKFRLTGGEPLVRKGIIDLIREMVAIEGVRDVSLTTNGVLLKEFAQGLKRAGLRRINVSLDTLKRERFAYITRRDHFDEVWEGIEEAIRLNFSPVKINVVAIRGFNGDEIEEFARLALEYPLHIRFIEFMPVGENEWDQEKVIPYQEIRERSEGAMGRLMPVPREEGDGPARRFRLPKGKGEVGFISPLTRHFCKDCNRLRLTPDGKIRTCLFSDEEIDMRGILRDGSGDGAIVRVLQEALSKKPAHPPREGIRFRKCQRGMSSIGG